MAFPAGVSGFATDSASPASEWGIGADSYIGTHLTIQLEADGKTAAGSPCIKAHFAGRSEQSG
jgi:hypothetical protein